MFRVFHGRAAVPAPAPVLALHGSASSGRQWRPLADALPEREIAAPDLAQVADPRATAIAALEALSAPAHLVGHSFGAALAIDIALARPDLVRGLALYEPAAFNLLRGRGGADRAFEMEIRSVGRIAALSPPQAGMAAFIDYWNGDGAWEAASEATRARMTRLRWSVVRDFALIEQLSWSASALAHLRTPARVFVGAATKPLARRVSRIVADVARVEIEEIPGADHMAPVTAPEAVAPRLGAWIRAQDDVVDHGALILRPRVAA